MSIKKRSIALALAGILVCSSAFTGYTVKADTTYVTVDQLEAKNTSAPAKDEVVPDDNQYEYQKQELSAFCHFGPNTFNEIEWGEHYGSRTPDDIFMLEDDFDAETMVETLKEAGFQKLIITAKHHDGFCIWNSEYTTYDVESTSYANYNYDNMGGDILAEISAACTEYDMDMGLYLSPWDIHEPSYGYHVTEEGYPDDADGDGDAYDYNDFYNNQLEEILSNPIYGNNGHFNEVWMDGAKGSGANAQEYDFQRWFNTIQEYEGKGATDNDGNVFTADCMLFGAEAYTGVRWIGNESGLSNEETWSKSVTNKTSNTIDSNNIGHYHAGFSNGNQWTVPETDSRITSGWFWGTSKKTPATMTDLATRYFESVGYNSVMLLNVPPNNEGKIDDAILARVTEFGENVAETFATNKAAEAVITATEVRGDDIAYSPANVLDGNAATYWTVEDGTTSGSLLIDLGSTTTFDVVSIEESIEFGQRITSFKVEYSTDGTTWNTMDEGSTVGAKRLCRTTPVKAQYVKITVATNDTDVFTSASSDTAAKGTVPMIAEVGIYKASEGFELASAAPDGMTVIDERDSEFEFSSGWTDGSGTQFPIEGTERWANSGCSFTVTFTGTKIYLVGTIDPGHGTANVSIDGGTATSINTRGSERQLGQIIYESEVLSDGEHTLTLNTTGTIGVDGAYVINNGGVGMIGIENARYTMEEASEIQVKLIRTGGTSGEATVQLSPHPGSAIQDDYDTECITTVTFAPGETEKTAPVRTSRNTNTTGDQYFTVELTTETEGLILGFNSKARINIIDAEGLTVEKLQELVDECSALDSGLYTADSWAAFETALTAAEEKLAAGSMSNAVLKNTYEALEDAKEALVVRTEAYSATDRFQFPDIGETKTLEAEFVELHNDTSNDNGWPMVVAQRDWASNGLIVDAMGNGDYAVLYYNAPRTGTYTATVTYRSGSSANGFSCAEADDKIVGGSVTMGANDGAQNTHTGTIIFEVVEAGEGALTITGGSAGGPQLDKIVIEATDLDLFTYNVTKTAGENGTIAGPDTVTEGEDAEFTITANEGYEIADVTVNGRSVGAVSTYTVEDVDADITIAAAFVVEEFKYSTEDPFVFPSEVGASETLEAEYATLDNDESNDGGWPMVVVDDTNASGGQYIDAMNNGDYIRVPYTAEKAGTYKVVFTYSSGNPNNAISWSEENEQIETGQKVAGASDAPAYHTVEFEMKVVTAGAGTLIITPPTGVNGPRLDKFDITLEEIKEVPTVCEHTMGDWTVTTEATCETAGEQTRVCTKGCGETETQTIEATGHNYGNWTVTTEATCETAGEQTRECTNGCGETETQTIEATGHNYGDWTVTTEATCETAGEQTRVCTNGCEKTEKQTIEALGHAWAEDYTVDKEATCTEAGSKSKHCTRTDCDAKTDVTAIEATGHSYGEWVVVKEATTEEEGWEERVCACGEVEGRAIAKLPETDKPVDPTPDTTPEATPTPDSTPSTPEGSQGSTSSGSSVNTGDSAMIFTYVALMLAAAAVVFGLKKKAVK